MLRPLVMGDRVFELYRIVRQAVIEQEGGFYGKRLQIVIKHLGNDGIAGDRFLSFRCPALKKDWHLAGLFDAITADDCPCARLRWARSPPIPTPPMIRMP